MKFSEALDKGVEELKEIKELLQDILEALRGKNTKPPRSASLSKS